MQHLDPGTISMAALDESLDAGAQEHLDGCAVCTAEVRELNSVVLAARGDASEVPLESPDPQVWAAIHQELGLQQSLVSDPLAARPADPGTVRPNPDSVRAENGTARNENGPEKDGPGPVAVLAEHRTRKRSFSPRFLAAAVTVGVLTGAAAVWAAQQLGAEAVPNVVAESELDPLEGFTAGGSATVLSAEDGTRTLRITVTDQQADGYQEVWLIEPNLEQMYSLGVIGGGTSSLAIPDDVDLAAFPIVDVSDEPLDGDPVHSGVSVLRGTLAASAG